MRLDDSPMTDEDFVDALAEAARGVVMTDTGAGDELSAALERVAADPSRENLRAARAAYKAQTAN